MSSFNKWAALLLKYMLLVTRHCKNCFFVLQIQKNSGWNSEVKADPKSAPSPRWHGVCWYRYFKKQDWPGKLGLFICSVRSKYLRRMRIACRRIQYLSIVTPLKEEAFQFFYLLFKGKCTAFGCHLVLGNMFLEKINLASISFYYTRVYFLAGLVISTICVCFHAMIDQRGSIPIRFLFLLT